MEHMVMPGAGASGSRVVKNSLLTDYDVYLYREGKHSSIFEKLGSHLLSSGGELGAHFAVWAPSADMVFVMGDFNGWKEKELRLFARDDGSGIWEGFVPGVKKGDLYKYFIVSKTGYKVAKGDPYCTSWEEPPGTASRVWDLDYKWGDSAWTKARNEKDLLISPMSIYEVHLGSWRRPSKSDQFPTYTWLAGELSDYVSEMGFTHVELLPVMEHPFYGSWGYQVLGYFAPTSRYGSPQELMAFIDHMHANGIGVILDWVPSHFPRDEHGLGYFDGTHLYEYGDVTKMVHPDWASFVFDYGRTEVRSFLLSSAAFWLNKYHADGLRVDAVASMLYLDYSRKPGEWIPNVEGGRENLEAVSFLKDLNRMVYSSFPGAQMIAEESTAWPMVSRPTYSGGLGFGFKWNMGWMHDALDYFSKEPVYRKYLHDRLTFSIWYAFSENFILPLSHDEVVHGKGSLIGRMPGDEWRRYANLRLLFGYMFSHPGKKLLFMGDEFAQGSEWNHDSQLDWASAEGPLNTGVRRWVRDLNQLLSRERALYSLDSSSEGFEWMNLSDRDSSVVSFLRKSGVASDNILVVCNFTPVVRSSYVVPVPEAGLWRELLNSDGKEYGGSGVGNMGQVKAMKSKSWRTGFAARLTLPPLAVLLLKRVEE
jgi:1,4-alpha-glucan branching enzyme